jgi:arylsulfatase
VVLCVALIAAGCAGDLGSDPQGPCTAIEVGRRPDNPSIVLIVNDAMRRDYVGIYGGRAATPNFDAFARENLYFDEAFSNAPWTKPSIATLFTSTYPSQHALASHPELRERMRRDTDSPTLPEVDMLSDGYTTLAELLRDAGYRTAAFVSNPWMSKEFGFSQGFEVYDDSFARWEADGLEVSRAALEWLAGIEPDEKFFLYVHYVDSHQPYGTLQDPDVWDNLRPLAKGLPPKSAEARRLFKWLTHHEQQQFTAKTVAQLDWLGPSVAFVEMAYARGIEDFDRALGTFLGGFREHAAWENSAVVITSDHGEALFQRDYGSHGVGLYDDELAIPFAAKLPGVRVREPRVECSVELIDVLPTLCSYLGIEAPEHAFGRDFLGSSGSWFGVSEGVMFKSRNRTIRNRSYKLLWEPDGPAVRGGVEMQLFNVAEDPAETRNLLSPDRLTEQIQQVADSLSAEIESAVPPFDTPAAEFAPLDPALEERLRALGYLE